MNSTVETRPSLRRRPNAAIATAVAVYGVVQRVSRLLLAALLAPPLEARTAYLMRSVDHADLERRQRAWDDMQR